jgi:3-oxoacyl-[acyl-carrier protein] reductase
MDLQLHDKRVLITGSSRGIGFGIAQEFLKEGAFVCLTGKTQDHLRKAKTALQRRFGVEGVLGLCGDLSEPAVQSRLVAFILKHWKRLDVLVLNLGSGKSVSGLVADPAEWHRVLHLNLVSAMETLVKAEPLLEKGQSPAVVLIGSIAGMEAINAPLPYGAAKAGLLHSMKAASVFLGKKNIRINMIAPGNVFFENGTWDLKLRENRKQVMRMLDEQVPLRRFGTIEEIGSAVVFLASEKAGFISGACLVVDGGQTRSI